MILASILPSDLKFKKKRMQLLVLGPHNLTVDIRKERIHLQMWPQGGSLLLWEEGSASGFPIPPRTTHGQGEGILPRLLPQVQLMDIGISKVTVKLDATTQNRQHPPVLTRTDLGQPGKLDLGLKFPKDSSAVTTHGEYARPASHRSGLILFPPMVSATL